MRYYSVCDAISEIDAGHGIAGHREVNGIYRKVKGKRFWCIQPAA